MDALLADRLQLRRAARPQPPALLPEGAKARKVPPVRALLTGKKRGSWLRRFFTLTPVCWMLAAIPSLRWMLSSIPSATALSLGYTPIFRRTLLLPTAAALFCFALTSVLFPPSPRFRRSAILRQAGVGEEQWDRVLEEIERDLSQCGVNHGKGVYIGQEWAVFPDGVVRQRNIQTIHLSTHVDSDSHDRDVLRVVDRWGCRCVFEAETTAYTHLRDQNPQAVAVDYRRC